MNKQPALMQDARDFGPPPPRAREAPWEKLYRFFFGDDVFISYSRADAIRYVPSLAAQLAAKGHICFFDQLAADPSQGLPETLKKKILRSTVFVLVGTRGAVLSPFVRKEVELFRRTRRPFIPVDVDGVLVDQEGWQDVIGVAKIREEGARVRDGDPSPEVVNLIKDSFRYVRRSSWLRASILAGLCVITLTAVVSFLLIRAAVAEAATIKRRAEADVAAAQRQVAEAGQRLQSLTARANQLKAEADAARNEAEGAAATARAADLQRKTAEHAMRRAQELERQAAERAADTARREAGSRASLRAREPGMEAAALALAVNAAEQVAAGRGPFPKEVLDGVVASATAADYSLTLEDMGGDIVSPPVISPDGKKISALVSNPLDRISRLVIWDALTGRKLSDDPSPIKGPTGAPSFSRDGSRFVTVSSSEGRQVVSVWDATGPQPRPVASRCGDGLGTNDAALDGNGSHVLIAVYSSDGPTHVAVCEVATGRTEDLPGVFQPGAAIAFSPEDEAAVYGSWVAPAEGGPQPSVIFPRSGRRVTLALPANIGNPEFKGFGDDGSIIMLAGNFAVGGERSVYIQSPDGDVRRLAGYSGTIWAAAFADGRARVVTVSGGTVRVADARSSPDFAALRAHTQSIDLVTFSPDGRTILTVDNDGKGRLWDLQTGGVLRTINVTDASYQHAPPGMAPRKVAAFSADGARLVTGNDKGEIQTWDVETGRPVCPTPGAGRADGEFLIRVAFVGGGDYVMGVYSGYSPETSRVLKFLDSRTCTPTGTYKFDESISIFSVSWDGMSIMTGSSEDAAPSGRTEFKVWTLRGVDLRGGAQIRLSSTSVGTVPGPLRRVEVDGRPMSVAWADKTGQMFLSVGNSSVPLEGNRDNHPSVYPIIFSADGTRLVTLEFGEARAWDARSGKLIIAFRCESDSGSSQPVALSSDGSKLAVAGKDHTVRIYPTSPEGFLRVARHLLGR